MNDFQRRIENNIRKGKKVSGEEVFEGIVFSLVKKTSISLQDICNAPTPLILSLNKRLGDYYSKKK